MAPQAPSSTAAKTQAFQFERHMHKRELVLLRSWQHDIASRKCWKDRGDTALAFVKLFLHEVFCLREWREVEGRSRIGVPDIRNNKDQYREHLAVACRWIAAERKKIEAMEDCDAKTEALEGIDFHEDWARDTALRFD